MSRIKLAVLILFTPFFCYAEDSGTQTKMEVIFNWYGGLNSSMPPHKIDNSYSPNMRNMFVHRTNGSIITRNGYIQVGSTNTLQNGRFMFTFNKEDGSKEFLVSDSSSVLSTKDWNTYVTVSTGLNSNVNLECTQAWNKAWCTNGSDPVFTWDGTSKVNLDGTNGTPNVPRFRYITTFQERVFGLNTSGNGSSLNFSDVASTNGVAIAPDNYLAWPVVNQLNVGQGDGEIGTALWIYGGLLQIGKENSIYTLFGSNLTNYQAKKMVANTGVQSQDSVVVQDGMTYFKSKYGIYRWGGGEPERISDLINPDVNNMIGFNSKIVQNIWDRQSDFLSGTFFNSTATADGSLNIVSSVKTGYGQTYDGSQPSKDLDDNGTTSYYEVFVPTVPVDFNFSGYLSSFQYVAKNNCGGCLSTGTFSFINERTGQASVSVFNVAGGLSAVSVFPPSRTGGLTVTGADIANSTFAFKITLSVGHVTFIKPPYTEMYLVSNNTASFISNVATVTSNTAWSSFNSFYNSNQGSVNYYVRTSPGVGGISTQAWSSIAPGAQINASASNLFIQWMTSVTATDQSNFPSLPTIDNVTIDHIVGVGDIYRPFAINWNNEYWLTVATQTRVPATMTYVKAWISNPNPNAWMPMDNMNIASFCKDGIDVLYAGSISTGTFYRLDYGTNDNGSVIPAFYDTPDMTLDNPFYDKYLSILFLDADKNPGQTINLGISKNGGDFVYNNLSLDGTGRYVKRIYNGINQNGNSFQFRFLNTQKDQPMKINSFGLKYNSTNINTIR